MKHIHTASLIKWIGLTLKSRNVKEVTRYKMLLIVTVLITFTAKAQDYQNNRNTDATLLKINDNSCNEEKPVQCYLTYSDYTKKLEVKRAVFIGVSQTEIGEESANSNSFKFNLSLNLDKDEMQENIASGKIFSTYGLFTLNNRTRDELVQYSLLPAHVNSSDDFNISLMVNITPEDFEVTGEKGKWILKVNDAVINRADD